MFYFKKLFLFRDPSKDHHSLHFLTVLETRPHKEMSEWQLVTNDNFLKVTWVSRLERRLVISHMPTLRVLMDDQSDSTAIYSIRCSLASILYPIIKKKSVVLFNLQECFCLIKSETVDI